MATEATRTGSFPSLGDRPSPQPPPPHGTAEWYVWAASGIRTALRDAAVARATVEHLEKQIGRPPIPAAKDAGAGMWLVLADVRADCTTILAKLDAADKVADKREGWAARVGWRVLELLIAAAVGWALLFLSGHWR